MSKNPEEQITRRVTSTIRARIAFLNALLFSPFPHIRSLRDHFALGLGASEPVRTIVAAKAFRLWLRSRQASEVSDEERVRFSSPAAVNEASIGRDVVLTAGVLRKAYRERSKVMEELLSAAARGSFDSLECDPGSAPAGGVVVRAEQRGEDGGVEGCAALVEDAGANSAAPTYSKRTKPKKSKRAVNSPTKSDGPTRSAIKAKDKASGKERGRKRRSDATNIGRDGIKGGSPARRVLADATKSTPDSSAEQTKKKNKKKRRNGEPAHVAGETTPSATAGTKESKAEGAGKSGSKTRAKAAKRQKGIEQGINVAKVSEPDTCAQARQQETLGRSPSKKKKKERKRDERKVHAEEPRCPVEAEGHVRTGQGIIHGTAETVSAERLRLSQAPKSSASCIEKSKQPFKSRTVRLLDWIAHG